MSLASWKKEFYRTPASKAPERNAVAHSIRKWTGLLKKNLEKHGLHRSPYGRTINDEDCHALEIDSSSCALCEFYMRDPEVEQQKDCSPCPLFKVRCANCDRPTQPESVSPYRAWLDYSDAKPMLRWLKKAQKWEEKQKKLKAAK